MKKKKLKIRKSIAKRFRITKKGKVLFRGSHCRHLKRKKTKSQKRAQKVPQKLASGYARKIKKLLGK